MQFLWSVGEHVIPTAIVISGENTSDYPLHWHNLENKLKTNVTPLVARFTTTYDMDFGIHSNNNNNNNNNNNSNVFYQQKNDANPIKHMYNVQTFMINQFFKQLYDLNIESMLETFNKLNIKVMLYFFLNKKK